MSDPTQSRQTPALQTDPDVLRADPHLVASSAPTRRRVLRAAGLVAVVGGGAAALAACGAEGSAAPTTSAAPASAASSSTASSSAPSSSAPSASAESSSAAPSASETSAAPDGPRVTRDDVPVGSGVIMPDADYVVTQPEAGTYKAFSKICTHQGCAVSMISNSEIVCNCHGSHFSIRDGSVISGPADSPLPESKTTVSGDTIVVSA